MNIFDLIISQSGDEGEVEILFRKKDFDTIQNFITVFVKDYIIGNLKYVYSSNVRMKEKMMTICHWEHYRP